MQHLETNTGKTAPRCNRSAWSTTRHPAGLLTLVSLFALFTNHLVASPAHADDRELGEYLSSQCTTCHQRSGKAKGIPSIIGWDRESFLAIMNAYRKKERENKVMQTIAGSLSDEDISALATYFSSLKPTQQNR